MTRYRLTMVSPAVGYESFDSVGAALAQAHEHTAGEQLRRQLRKTQPGWRLVDGTGTLRGLISPINGAGKPLELGVKRSAQLKVKCLPEERERWQRAAKERGETLSGVVRECLAERYGAG